MYLVYCIKTKEAKLVGFDYHPIKEWKNVDILLKDGLVGVQDGLVGVYEAGYRGCASAVKFAGIVPVIIND